LIYKTNLISSRRFRDIAFPKQLRYIQILLTKVSSFKNVPH